MTTKDTGTPGTDPPEWDGADWYSKEPRTRVREMALEACKLGEIVGNLVCDFGMSRKEAADTVNSMIDEIEDCRWAFRARVRARFHRVAKGRERCRDGYQQHFLAKQVDVYLATDDAGYVAGKRTQGLRAA